MGKCFSASTPVSAVVVALEYTPTCFQDEGYSAAITAAADHVMMAWPDMNEESVPAESWKNLPEKLSALGRSRKEPSLMMVSMPN